MCIFTLLLDHAYPIYRSSGATEISQRRTLPRSRPAAVLLMGAVVAVTCR